MIYRVAIGGDVKGLNELLDGRMYNYRTRRYLNNVKLKNDNICLRLIKQQLKGVKIKSPVCMHYKLWVKDLKHDFSNLESGFIKSVEDALQKAGCLKNDGALDIVGKTIDYELNRKNKYHVMWVEIEELPAGTTKVPDAYDWSEFKKHNKAVF